MRLKLYVGDIESETANAKKKLKLAHTKWSNAKHTKHAKPV